MRDVMVGRRDAEPALAAHLDLLLELDAPVLGVLAGSAVPREVGAEHRVGGDQACLAKPAARRVQVGGGRLHDRARRLRTHEGISKPQPRRGRGRRHVSRPQHGRHPGAPLAVHRPPHLARARRAAERRPSRFEHGSPTRK